MAQRPLLLHALAGLIAGLLQTSTAAAQVTVSGVVYDSLLVRGPLEGAQVVLDGVDAIAVSDRRGRFSFPRVAPGRYLATFFHPRLDSLSLSAPVVAVEVGAEDRRGLLLATPSYQTTARALCGVELDTTTSIVLARIRDAEAGNPLPGAIGELRWWEMALGDGAALTRVNQRMTARADSTGAITLCGVPNDIELEIVARQGRQTTGQVVLPRGMAPLVAQELRISLSDSAAQVAAASENAPIDTIPRPRGGRGRLRLQVRDANGRPIANAAAFVRGQAVGGVTDESGRVVISGVPAGSQTVDVRAIGRAPEARAVALIPGQETTLALQLGDVADQLPDYVVRGIRPDAELEAFERRRRAGLGRFLDSDDLNKLGRRAAGLATLPGVRVPFSTVLPNGAWGFSGGQFPMIYLRSAAGEECTPTVFIDGIPRVRIEGFEFHSMLQLATRLELYNRPIGVPPEFSSGAARCGVVAIWTR